MMKTYSKLQLNKVLKETEPFYVAAYRADSKSPENDAFISLKSCFDRNKIADSMPNYRVYGYDRVILP